jgi:tetratricopeptide (TPR) repeat protein
LRRGGAPGDVLADARDAIARGADSPTLRLSLAAALAASGDRDAAAREYEKLLPERGARGRAVEALAELYARGGDPARLVGLREKAARLAPGDPAGRVALARAYRAAGRWTSAVETCRSLLADDPGQADCRYLLADLYAERGQAEAAEMTLQARLSQSPEDVAALTRLARLYAAEGRHAEARTRYLRVLAIEPGNAEARAALGGRAGGEMGGEAVGHRVEGDAT